MSHAPTQHEAPPRIGSLASPVEVEAPERRPPRVASPCEDSGGAAHVGAPASPPVDGPELRLADAMEASAREALLSPRVVDQRAFDQLASALHGLMRQAASEGRGLAGTAAQVRLLGEQLRGLVKDVQVRTEAALKALPLLDTKLSQAQQVLHRVTGEAALQRARDLRDTVMRELDASRDAMIEECVATALATARVKIEEEAGRLQSLAQAQHEAAPAPRTTSQPEAPTGGESAITPNSSHSPHAELLAELARKTLDEIETGVAMSEARLAAIQDATDRLLAQAETSQRSLEEAQLRAQVRTETTLAEHHRRVEDVASEVAAQLIALREDANAATRAALREVREGIEQATRRHGASTPGRGDDARDEPDARARAIDAIGQIDAASARAVERVLAASESARRGVDDTVRAALDRLGSAAMDARQQASVLRQEADDARRELRSLLDHAARESKDREAGAPAGLAPGAHGGALTPDAAQLAVLGSQLHQMGAWLVQVLHAAQIEGARLEALRASAASADREGKRGA